jgi:RimJ/RimL family protein N-acetyltransferase
MKFSPDSLDLAKIHNLKRNIPPKFELQKINRDNIRTVDSTVHRTIDLHFGSINGLLKQGVGFCVVHRKRIVSLAYSAFPFIDEFEVQVDTVDNPYYRRKGLATAVSAALIEHALENDIVPHWDAANLASRRLAEKLGYSDPVSWEAYYRKKS